MKSDHAAHLSLVQDAEKNHLPQHQVKQANEAARQHKHQKNVGFWHRVMNVLTVIAIAIVIYTLIHFAGLI